MNIGDHVIAHQGTPAERRGEIVDIYRGWHWVRFRNREPWQLICGVYREPSLSFIGEARKPMSQRQAEVLFASAVTALARSHIRS